MPAKIHTIDALAVGDLDRENGGRIVRVPARGQHSITTPTGRINVSYRNLQLLQRGDGYAYDVRQEPVFLTSGKSG